MWGSGQSSLGLPGHCPNIPGLRSEAIPSRGQSVHRLLCGNCNSSSQPPESQNGMQLTGKQGGPKFNAWCPCKRKNRRPTQRRIPVRTEAEVGGTRPAAQGRLEPRSWRRQEGRSPGASGGRRPCPAWTPVAVSCLAWTPASPPRLHLISRAGRGWILVSATRLEGICRNDSGPSHGGPPVLCRTS